jgi:hypothetical protein
VDFDSFRGGIMQTVTVTCVQKYDLYGDSITASGSIEGLDMGLDCWRQAITAAAMAASFHPDVLNRMILEWAEEIEGAK